MEPGTGMTVVRGLMVVLVATLGVLALTSGRVAVGVVLLALAALRVVMLVMVRHRRSQRRQRLEHWRQVRARRGMGS